MTGAVAALPREGTAATALVDDARADLWAVPAPIDDGIFDETFFAWPVPVGNPKKDAKIPLFRFDGPDEARTFLRLTVWTNILFALGLVNGLALQSTVVGVAGFVLGAPLQLVYIGAWIRLCKRAHPAVPRWNWPFPGLGNKLTWQALIQARGVLRPE